MLEKVTIEQDLKLFQLLASGVHVAIQDQRPHQDGFSVAQPC
jgi:hypothetical protein